MTRLSQSGCQPSVVSSRLTSTSLNVVATASILLCTVSILAMSLGDPELMAIVAIIGIAVLVLGLAVLTVDKRLTPPTAPFES